MIKKKTAAVKAKYGEDAGLKHDDERLMNIQAVVNEGRDLSVAIRLCEGICMQSN